MFTTDSSLCLMYTAFLDSFNGVVLHTQKQVNIAVVAKAPLSSLMGGRISEACPI